MRYFLVNWKMYPTVEEARALLLAVQTGLLDRLQAGVELPRVIVCPPFVALVPLGAVADGQVVRLGAQTCHWEQEGPYTGEISPRMLQGLVEYVLVGHSERRAAGETDEHIARKVAAVADAGFVPILFVGEDEPGADAIRRTEQRLRDGLSGVDVDRQDVLVVYEPTWAIGGDQAASADHVRRAVEHLKGVLADMGAGRSEVLYGGTVSPDNVEEFAGLEVLDGVGAARSSLQAEGFLGIIDRLTGHRADG